MAILILDADEIREYIDEFEALLDEQGASIKDVIETGVTAWLEALRPTKFSGRLTRKEILSLLIEDRFPVGQMSDPDSVYDLSETAFFIVDLTLSKVVCPHSTLQLEFAGWLGDSFLIRTTTARSVHASTPGRSPG